MKDWGFCIVLSNQSNVFLIYRVELKELTIARLGYFFLSSFLIYRVELKELENLSVKELGK